MPNPVFSAEEWLRYSRHIQLPKFGATAQTQLKNSHVVIIGMGGLGCPAALYLAAAGVGKLTLIDGDTVELSNLQRQVLYTVADIGKEKVDCAKKHLQALNPSTKIISIATSLTVELLPTLNKNGNFDLILDCTDNFPTRYLINDFALQSNTPWIYASVHQYAGQCAVFQPGGACFRCLYPSTSANTIEDCNSGGVIGVLPGLLGLFQANEAIRYLGDLPNALNNQLMILESDTLQLKTFELSRDPSCDCKNQEAPLKPESYAVQCAAHNAPSHFEISASLFNQLRDQDAVIVLDVRSTAERAGFHIGGTHLSIHELTSDELQTQIQQLSTAHRYLCYCQSGKRSGLATQTLAKAGLNAQSLSGGLQSWLKTSIENSH